MCDDTREACLPCIDGILLHPFMNYKHEFTPKSIFAILLGDDEPAQLVIVLALRLGCSDSPDRLARRHESEQEVCRCFVVTVIASMCSGSYTRVSA